MKKILTLLAIACLIGCKSHKKNLQEEKEMKEPEVEIVSPVINRTKFDSTKNRPSYSDPLKYSIVKTEAGFIIMLPGGTMDDVVYKTQEECQSAINVWAKQSYERWIKSYGTLY